MKTGLAAFAVAALLMVGLPLVLMQGGGSNRGTQFAVVTPGTAEYQFLVPRSVDVSYANPGYLQTIIGLPSRGQRFAQMARYYALLERQNRGVGQAFDPKLAAVLALDDSAERRAAFARWDVGPKPTVFRP